jgi:hypothetical protein
LKSLLDVIIISSKLTGHYCRKEQYKIFIGVKSIYKGLLPKQHIKYKTKKLLNTIKLHIHVWNACLPNDIWYEEVVQFKYDLNINQKWSIFSWDYHLVQQIAIIFFLTKHKNILCRNHKIINQSTHFSYYIFCLLPSQ